MLTGTHDKQADAFTAIKLLQNETHYFDQLAIQFPFYDKALLKHASDCRQVTRTLQNRIDQGNQHDTLSSIRVAHVFLQEGQRQRLKLRIELLRQESTALELEANRWPPMASEFKTLAAESRQFVKECRNKIHCSSPSDIEEDLVKASTLYENSQQLRTHQREQRRQDIATTLLRKIVQLHDEADLLEQKSTTYPALKNKYLQLSSHCRQTALRLEARVEPGTYAEIEKVVNVVDTILGRVRLSQEKAEFNHQDRNGIASEHQPDNEFIPLPVQGEEKTNEVISHNNDQTLYESPEFTQELRTKIQSRQYLFRFRQSFSWVGGLFAGIQSFTQITSAKFVRVIVKNTGYVLLRLVGTLVIITIIAMVLYLSGAGFSSIGIF